MSSRPLYETEEDRRNERAIADRIAALHGWTAQKLPPRYGLDFALVEGREVRLWLEVKRRRVASDAFPDYLLSLAKLTGLLDLQERTSIRAALAVGWTDRIGLLAFPALFRVEIGGRRDRGDEQDVEPVALFPIARFKLLPWGDVSS